MKNIITRAFLSLMATFMIFSLMTFVGVTGNEVESSPVITVQAAAKKIGLNKTKATVTTGASYTVKLLDKNGKTISATKVKWSTSNKKIATVSKKGAIKGVKKGTATITATYKNKKYTCKVTVKNATLSNTKKTLVEGKSFTLKLKDAAGKTVSADKIQWSTSDKKIATVSKKGVVKAVGNGTATISAKYLGVTYKCKVTAKGYIILSKSNIDIYYGDTDKRTVKVTLNDSSTIYYKIIEGGNLVNVSWSQKWKDSTTSLFITPKYGNCTGIAKIKIYTETQPKKYKVITVNFKTPTLKLSKTSATLKEGTTLKLTATTTPSSKSVTWSTSDKNVATVSSSGVVTPVRAGTCEITAKYKYGSYSYEYVEAKCKVTCTFEGSDLKAPLSAQSGKVITLQKFSSQPSYKVKINVTKVVRGAQANQLAIKENSNNKTTSGYEWCFIYADIEHISNSDGSNTILEAVDVLYKDDLFTASGASVTVKDMATFSHSLKGSGVFDVKLYPGGTASAILGVLIPESTGDILLRVPNLKSNTWIKLPAPSDLPASGDSGSGSGSGSGTTTPPTPVLGTPSENLAVVKAYINKYGSNVNSSTKRITHSYSKDNYSYNSEIEYNISNDTVWYSLNVYTDKNLTHSLVLKFSDTVSPVTAKVILYGWGMPQGDLSVLPSAYTSGVVRSFSWSSVGGSTITEAERNNVASSLLDVGFALFDLIIFEKTGISITDIGFTSYGY